MGAVAVAVADNSSISRRHTTTEDRGRGLKCVSVEAVWVDICGDDYPTAPTCCPAETRHFHEKAKTFILRQGRRTQF